MSEPLARPEHPRFFEAFRFWLKLGFISFGGPAGQIGIMHQELVERRRWISERRFLHALNYCMVLPGPEAQQLAIYIGWMLHRTWGGIVAGALFVLPSLFILAALTYVYLVYGDVTFVQGVFNGIKPAVVAIVGFAAWRIGTRALKNRLLWGFAAASFIAIFVFRVPFPLIVITAGILGFIGGWLAPDKFRVGGGHGSAVAAHGPALIDDDTPPPAHARFRPWRLALLVVLFVALWAVAMAMLTQPDLRDMGTFFTKAALVTFGGAYAVLAYVNQQVVEAFGWITQTQAVAGLALAETTPGPLVIVLQFMGFMAGWNDPGALGQAQGAVLAALLAAWATFLPSFVFIFLGAPHLEKLRANARLAGAMAGITAAVVGVIASLAVSFGRAVLLPGGAEAPAWGAIAIALAALLLLLRTRLEVLWVIAGGALAGLLLGVA